MKIFLAPKLTNYDDDNQFCFIPIFYRFVALDKTYYLTITSPAQKFTKKQQRNPHKVKSIQPSGGTMFVINSVHNHKRNNTHAIFF